MTTPKEDTNLTLSTRSKLRVVLAGQQVVKGVCVRAGMRRQIIIVIRAYWEEGQANIRTMGPEL